MKKYGYGLVWALIAFVMTPVVPILVAADPSTQPLIQFGDLSYLGSFRLPDQFVNNDGFTLGGFPLAFNPSRNSLFISSRSGNVAEVAIPALVNGNDVTKLNFSSFLQGFYEPTEGLLAQVSPTGSSISGLLVLGDQLYGSASIYYDANNIQRVSHYARSTTLSTPSAVGMRQVWTDEHSGFVSGFMSVVPEEWRATLGGAAITGQCCIPVAWRTSWGPSAFAFNPSDINSMAKVPATPLLYYPDSHPTLGLWDHSNPTYGGTTQINGVAILAGTRTVLYFGRNGTGAQCYGNGTNDPNLAGTLGVDGALYCYDPTSTAKGQHAYPYNYQIWAYDLNDLAAVKAGTKQPWDLRPYGVWPFGLPFNEPEVRIGGIGYDSSRQIIYISQLYADKDGYGYRPIIHALKVGGGAAGTPLPPPDTTTLPPVSNSTPSSPTITALAITANKTAPQGAATAITFSATPTGGAAPHEFKWLVHDGAAWSVVGDWSTSMTFTWTPAAANPNYRVGVWVRSGGKTSDIAEQTSSMDFAISGVAATAPPPPTSGPTTGARLLAVALSANLPAPQPAGSTITFSAVPNGGATPQQYKWLLHDGSSWRIAGDWSTSNTFNWTPAAANGACRVGVWVRSAGNSVDAGEVTASMDFPISTTSATPAPKLTAPSTAGLSAVALTANQPAPQPQSTTITFTATPNGGAAPHQYRWLIHDGTQWTFGGDWTTSNAFNWTPAAANPSYRFGVWVRSACNMVDAGEATASIDFPITASTTTTAPAPAPTTAAKLTAVALGANKPSPQPQNTTIMFTATPNGGAAPQQYKWLMHDGVQWKVIGDWTTANTFNWTPVAWNPNSRIGVWVRSAGNAVDAGEVTASIDYAITASTATAPVVTTTTTTAPLSAVTLGANKIAPQAAGSGITFTAIPTGGVAPQQYKFLLHDGAQWAAVTGWTTSNTFNWTPAAINPNYRVGVWVRNAGNTVDAGQVTASIDYPIR